MPTVPKNMKLAYLRKVERIWRTNHKNTDTLFPIVFFVDASGKNYAGRAARPGDDPNELDDFLQNTIGPMLREINAQRYCVATSGRISKETAPGKYEVICEDSVTFISADKQGSSILEAFELKVLKSGFKLGKRVVSTSDGPYGPMAKLLVPPSAWNETTSEAIH